MRVRNNKTGKEYDLGDKEWNKLKDLGLSGRYSILKEAKAATFKPKELKEPKA